MVRPPKVTSDQDRRFAFTFDLVGAQSTAHDPATRGESESSNDGAEEERGANAERIGLLYGLSNFRRQMSNRCDRVADELSDLRTAGPPLVHSARPFLIVSYKDRPFESRGRAREREEARELSHSGRPRRRGRRRRRCRPSGRGKRRW
jgi:hypothetical protein